MAWMTGNWMNQSVPGLENIYRSTATPATPAAVPSSPAPTTPAGGDYWAQLGSLLGMTPTTPQAQAYSPWWQQQQQMIYNQIPGTSFSIAGAGDYMARMQQAMAQRAQQQAQSPSAMFAGMPSMNAPSQQYLQGSNQGRSNPFRRSDGSVITPEAYMAGDRPGMTGSPNAQSRPQAPISRPERPQLAPPLRPGKQPKRPSDSFALPTERGGGLNRASIPGFSNFVY